MKPYRILLTLALCVLGLSANAQVPIEHTPYKVSKISPKYFGPYAFPVPDMLDARICSTLEGELSFDSVVGTLAGDDARDRTVAPTFRVSVPLWTDRATLSIWGEMHEWYSDTPKVRELRRVAASEPLKCHDAGSVYFSLDMLVLKEREKVPSITVRAATQSATGDDYERARHYDAPGYFFDAAVGKSFGLGGAGSIRTSVSGGFLCWQRDRGAQNDASMIAAQLSYNQKFFDISASYAQYSGWEKDGDCPRVLKARLDAHLGMFSPFVYVQHGLHDWPFTMVRVGLTASFDVLQYFR